VSTPARQKAIDQVWGSFLGGIQQGANKGGSRLPATRLTRPQSAGGTGGRMAGPGAGTSESRRGWRPVTARAPARRSPSRVVRRGASGTGRSQPALKPSQIVVQRHYRRGETGRHATPPLERVRATRGNTRPDLRGADLVGVDLDRDDLRGADLGRANLYRARLSGAQLSGASLWAADLVEADLTGARLDGADMLGAGLVGADLSRASLRQADMKKTSLIRARLTGADLDGANLTDADLTQADLRHARLTGANLRGADFTGAKLAGASLRGAFFSRETRWPAGFNPAAHGALQVD
jgi:uncharacterized protein YjbI with pentapeptide repeats